MTHRVILTPRSERDLIRLETLLVSKSAVAAARALDVLEAAINSLARFPERGRQAGEARRELVVPFSNGNYLIRYRVSGETVLIGRILHNKEVR